MLDRVVIWPPNYVKHFEWRQKQLLRLRTDPKLVIGAKEYYRTRPVEFIEHWGVTVETRISDIDTATTIPFILFKRQKELIQFLLGCLDDQQSGLIEKSRDMGATWVCCAMSAWLWLFRPGVSIGWSSRVLELVDVIGDVKSIFQKIRVFILNLPPEFWPAGFRPADHLSFKRLINPETHAVISGEGGDNIGRGGRSLIYFKDESAWYERPEMIEAALTSNTNCQIDISSVHGIGNVFHQKREAGVDWYPNQPKIASGKTRVFVMDWRDHPAKTQAWYDEHKLSFIERGLQHIWAQEVDRNYGASVVGVIIPPEWVESAVDAHTHLGFTDDGLHVAALDIADEGVDTNALAIRKGIVLRTVEEWGERDTGVTARRAIAAVRGLGSVQSPIELQYDFGGGWGSSVKAEGNRLMDEGVFPKTIRLVAWNAGGEVLNPDKHLIPRDKDSPLNKDFFANFKAQGWWLGLRRRFELTHRARIEPGFTWDAEDLISIDSRIPLLRKLKKELSQPTAGQSSKLKLMVNKQPDGAKSPNLADAVMMCYWPVPVKKSMYISAAVLAQASIPGLRR